MPRLERIAEVDQLSRIALAHLRIRLFHFFST